MDEWDGEFHDTLEWYSEEAVMSRLMLEQAQGGGGGEGEGEEADYDFGDEVDPLEAMELLKKLQEGEDVGDLSKF